jgi:hypothetical protein
MSTSHTKDLNSSSSAELCAQLDNILNTPFVPQRRFCVAEMLLLATVVVFVGSNFISAFDEFNGLALILISFAWGGILLGLGAFGVFGFSRDKTLVHEKTLKNFINSSEKCVAIDPSLAPLLARIAQEMENNHLNAWWQNINGCLQQFIDHNSVAVVPVAFENQKQQFIEGLHRSNTPAPQKTTFFKL